MPMFSELKRIAFPGYVVLNRCSKLTRFLTLKMWSRRKAAVLGHVLKAKQALDDACADAENFIVSSTALQKYTCFAK
jgi:hypothetical protein